MRPRPSLTEALLVRLVSSSTCPLSIPGSAVHPVPMAKICKSSVIPLSLSLIFYIQPVIMSCGFYPRFSHFYRLLHLVFLPGSAASWFSRLAVAFSLVSKTPFFSHFKPVFHTRAEIIYWKCKSGNVYSLIITFHWVLWLKSFLKWRF